MTGTPSRARSLVSNAPTLFLVAGVLLIGYAGLNGMKAFTDATVEPNLFEFGYAIGFLGLLSLYPRLVDRRPWLARAGAAAALSGAVAITAFNVRHLAELAGVASDGPAESAFVVMALVGFVLGYLAFGTAALRSDVHSRLTGLVLLIPGVIVVLMLAHIAAGFDSLRTAFVISAGQAMAHLAIGARLRAESESVDGDEMGIETASDATARG